ncbi:hypothetical protein [Phocaeicola barnesiae]|uniref:hypothetical protein n=1 Tax=Phocaeicola barnesiae TaxID=376804 RepID=UPI0003A13FFC|nr:hypothetical protein [Phocaeicola barnesiae]
MFYRGSYRKYRKNEADKQPSRVLFRDCRFSRDDTKINVFETLKQLLGWSE